MQRIDQATAAAVAETRSLLRSPLCWIVAALVVATGLGAYFVLAQMHARLWGFTSSSTFVSPRFLIHFFGIAPLLVLMFGVVLLAVDCRHRDERIGIAEALDARPFSNPVFLAGRLVARLTVAMVVLLLTFGTIQALGAAAQQFGWPVGVPLEPVSLAVFLVVDALPALAVWCALVLLLTVAVRNRALVVATAAALLAGLHWLLHSVPVYLLPAISPLSAFGTIASDVLPTFASSWTVVQRVLLLLLAAGMLTGAAAIHPRSGGGRYPRLASALAGAAVVVVAAGAVALLAVRSTDAMSLRDQWHAAQRAVDGMPRARLERIKGSVRIDPGDALGVDVELALAAPTEARVEEVVFSFNPAMTIHELKVDGEHAGYRHDSGLLIVRPPRPLEPGSAFALSLAATGVPDPRFSYLDESVDALAENWADSQLPLLGTVASIFDDDYVALMADTRWLPMPGPNLAVDPTRRHRDSFVMDLAVMVPEGWRVAAPGKGRPAGSPNQLRFKPGAPVTETTVVAAPLERFATNVGDVEFELLLHSGHVRHVELLADVPGLTEALVEQLAEFLEEADRHGIPYPFDGLSVVEVPARLRLYGGGWGMGSVQSRPGVLLMREHGFPTARLNSRLFALEGPPGATQALGRMKLLNVMEFFHRDRMGGNLLAGATDQLLLFQTQASGDDAELATTLLAKLVSAQFGVPRTTFSAHAFTGTSLSGTTAAGHPDTLAARLTSLVAGAVDRGFGAAGWDRNHPSLWERATYSVWSDITHGQDLHHGMATRALLGHVSAQALFNGLGRDGVATLLRALRNRDAGGALTLRDLEAAVAEIDPTLAPLIHDWAHARPAPAFRVSAVEVRALEGEATERSEYAVNVKVANQGAALGLVALEVGTDHGDGDGVLRRELSAPAAVAGHSSVEISMVSAKPPRDAWLLSYFSQNRNDTRLVLTDVDDGHVGRDDSLNVGTRPTAWLPPAEAGIVVDDLDPGFSVESSPASGLLRRLLAYFASERGAMPLDGAIPEYRDGSGEPGHMAASGPQAGWSRQAFGAAWGRFRSTLARTVSGDGRERAVFAARLPAAGRWQLEYHIPDLSPRPRYSWWGTFSGEWHGGPLGTFDIALTTGDEEAAIEFDGGQAAPGWNRLGTFTLDAGIARVVVSNRSSGETVIADAIRWFRVDPRR
ncbi:MAG: hypothetical protein OXH15_17075 [Gammaproteobacteria bacterium]|nr:hypothetical protein [Gammaproteobacteria bacterium]